MEFAILGPLASVGPDGPIELEAPKQRALLAMLLLAHRDDAVPADRLIDVLWGEDPPRDRAQGAAGLRLPAAARARARAADRHAAGGLRGRARAGRAGPRALRDARRARPRRARRRRPPTRPPAAARGARAVPRRRRWPTRRCSARPRPRPTGSPGCGSPRSSSASSSTSRSAATPRSPPSSRRWPPSTPTASGCTRS